MAFRSTLTPLLVLAGLLGGCALAGPASPGAPGGGWGWPWGGSTYRYLGQAHYVGKSLLAVEGEFAELAISPSGRQVAFRGRDAQNDYMILAADLNGSIRFLGKTDLEPRSLHWSQDETSLLFLTLETTREGMRPDAPPNIPPMPKGHSLQRMTLADGATHKVVELPGNGIVFPAPDNDRAAVYGFSGYGTSKANGPFALVETASGQSRSLGGSPFELHRMDQATWSPDGAKLAVAASLPQGGGMQLQVYRGPDWRGEVVASGLKWPGTVFWNPDGATLSSIQFDEQGLTVSMLNEQGVSSVRAQLPLESAPEGYMFSYTTVGMAPDGRRLLATRSAFSTQPQLMAVGGQPPPANLLVDLEANTIREVAPNLTPIGWLNERQVLCYAGSDQAKRLHMVDL